MEGARYLVPSTHEFALRGELLELGSAVRQLNKSGWTVPLP
jgi:hypothetical protein